jgi:hypothetical protein
MTVVQASEVPVVERNHRGQVSTTIGCVDAGRAELNIWVGGDVTDLSLEEALEDEERPIAAENATDEGTAHTCIQLDDEQARDVRRLASCGEPPQAG